MSKRRTILAPRNRQGGFIIDPFWATPATDPDFASVRILCHFDGTNGSTTYTNVPGAPATLTATGAATTTSISTAQSVFGGASLFTPGTSGRYVSIVLGSPSFATSDFTIEFRVYTTSLASNINPVDFRPPSSNGIHPTFRILTTGELIYYVNSADRITSSAGVISTNTWYAVAVSRVSGTTRLFLNGTQVGSSYTDSNNYVSTGGKIGEGAFGGVGLLNGYVDEFRVTIGVGRYSSTYTPATSAFPNS